jgi:hypothetical protein
MSYYRGDYYAGGIGSFFKSIGSIAASFIPGVGPVASKAISAIPTGAAKSGAIASAAGAGMAIVKSGASAVRSGIIKHPVLSAAGAAGAVGVGVGALGEHLMAPGGAACVRGFHMSKPRGGKCPSAPHLVRNRRMNIANGRALHRATRRLHAFAKHYRKVVGFVSPRKPKGHMYFKRRSKKK